MSTEETDGIFLHGIDLNNWLTCHNLSLCGKITSPNLAGLLEPALILNNIRDIPILTLRNSINIEIGCVTPRFGYIIAAPWIRKEINIGTGVDNTKSYSDEQKEHILHMSDVELRFEEIRRKIAPEVASRLACLWLADNSIEGKSHIKKMLGDDIYIIKVKILFPLRFIKVDSFWFDEYCDNPKEDYITNYWKSIPSNNNLVTWEYLLEGVFEMIDGEEKNFIQKYGKKVP